MHNIINSNVMADRQRQTKRYAERAISSSLFLVARQGIKMFKLKKKRKRKKKKRKIMKRRK